MARKTTKARKSRVKQSRSAAPKAASGRKASKSSRPKRTRAGKTAAPKRAKSGAAKRRARAEEPSPRRSSPGASRSSPGPRASGRPAGRSRSRRAAATPRLEGSVPGVTVLGKLGPRYTEIFAPEALAFLADLHRRFEPVRRRLLAARAARQTEIRCWRAPRFLV